MMLDLLLRLRNSLMGVGLVLEAVVVPLEVLRELATPLHWKNFPKDVWQALLPMYHLCPLAPVIVSEIITLVNLNSTLVNLKITLVVLKIILVNLKITLVTLKNYTCFFSYYI